MAEVHNPAGAADGGFHRFGQAYALLHNPTATLAGLVGGNLAATKPVQRALYGEGVFGQQKKLADLLRNHPDAAHLLGQQGKQWIIDEAQH